MKLALILMLNIFCTNAYAFTGRYSVREKNIQYESVKDTYKIAQKNPAWKTIPKFDFDYVQYGSNLSPVNKGLIITEGVVGYNYYLSTGKIISPNKVSLPFALIEKNANCTHNGVLEIDTSSQKNNASIKLFQETCKYHQFNLTGNLSISFKPNPKLSLPKTPESLPVKNISDLRLINSKINLDKLHSHLTKDHLSSYGLYFKGSHYQGNCYTRHGLYEHCSEMILPSFSTAKTSLAGVAMLHFAKLFGPDIFDLKIKDYVSEVTSLESWKDVSLENVLDMSTGHYESLKYGEDESGAIQNKFFLATDRLGKMNFALKYPKKNTPGKVFSYHSSDTYILNHALESFLQFKKLHTDLFDYLKKTIYTKASIPNEFSSLRNWNGSQENVGTSWASYGLWWKSDWLVKMAKFISIDQINNPTLLHQDLLLKSLGKKSDHQYPTGNFDYSYNNSFWIKEFGPKDGFKCSFKVPFMAGYGGIIVVMFPNDVIYYYVSDNDEKKWWQVAKEVDKLNPLCR